MCVFSAPSKLKIRKNRLIEEEEAFEEEDMLPRDLNNSTAYDFEHRPATKPLDVMTEAVFKGDETDFGQALHKIHKKVKIKGVTMKIPEINVNIRSVEVNNPRTGKKKMRLILLLFTFQ